MTSKTIEDIAAPSNFEGSDLAVGERIQGSLVELIVDPRATVGFGNCATFKLDDVPAIGGAFGNAVDWNKRGGRCNDGDSSACKEGPDAENHFL